MSQKQLHDALHEFTVAITKLSSVIHEALINPSIHAMNTSTTPTLPIKSDEPLGKLTEVVETDTSTGVTVGELDGEGRPYIDGLHAKTKSTMNSPEVKGATKWKFARGTSQEDKDAYHAKYPLSIDTVDAPVATTPSISPPPVASKPLPGTPPPVATTPTPPPVVDDKSEEVKRSILESLQGLVELGVEWDDLKEIFTEEFNSAQNGDQITLGSIPKDKYTDVDAFCATLLGKFISIDSMITELYQIAGEHKKLITDGLYAFYEQYQSKSLAGVHYTNLDKLTGDVNAMLNEWRKWANG